MTLTSKHSEDAFVTLISLSKVLPSNFVCAELSFGVKICSTVGRDHILLYVHPLVDIWIVPLFLMSERERERVLPSAGSLFKCLQWRGLCKLKTGARNLT